MPNPLMSLLGMQSPSNMTNRPVTSGRNPGDRNNALAAALRMKLNLGEDDGSLSQVDLQGANDSILMDEIQKATAPEHVRGQYGLQGKEMEGRFGLQNTEMEQQGADRRLSSTQGFQREQTAGDQTFTAGENALSRRSNEAIAGTRYGGMNPSVVNKIASMRQAIEKQPVGMWDRLKGNANPQIGQFDEMRDLATAITEKAPGMPLQQALQALGVTGLNPQQTQLLGQLHMMMNAR